MKIQYKKLKKTLFTIIFHFLADLCYLSGFEVLADLKGLISYMLFSLFSFLMSLFLLFELWID